MGKKIKNNKRIKKIKKIEQFTINELERYLKIHKEHEKDLSYIG
jgi:hypothetical protein